MRNKGCFVSVTQVQESGTQRKVILPLDSIIECNEVEDKGVWLLYWSPSDAITRKMRVAESFLEMQQRFGV